jgi:hypothetical protein
MSKKYPFKVYPALKVKASIGELTLYQTSSQNEPTRENPRVHFKKK